jgi:magnesium-transporting ATPase (P-type)
MDKDTKSTNVLTLIKLRSIGACIRDGYRLYTGNFRKIFRATWLIALVYGIVSGFIMSIQPLYASIGFLLINILLATYAFSLLKAHQDTEDIPHVRQWYGYLDRKTAVRTLIVAGILLVIGAVYGGLFYLVYHLGSLYLSNIATMVAVGVLALIVLLTSPAVMMPLFRHPLQSAGFASFPFRHWGAALMIAFVVVIVTGLMMLITELPAVVLFSANMVSQAGILQGDPSGMPDYMAWTNIIVFTIAGFIQAYVQLSSFFPIYYLYGSTVLQEKERRQVLS